MVTVSVQPGQLKELERYLDRVEARLDLLPERMRADIAGWIRKVRAEIAGVRGSAGLGMVWLIPAAVAAALAAGIPIGIWLRVRQEEARAVLKTMDCVDRLVKAGMSYEEAIKLCYGETESGRPWGLYLALGAAAAVLLIFLIRRV